MTGSGDGLLGARELSVTDGAVNDGVVRAVVGAISSNLVLLDSLGGSMLAGSGDDLGGTGDLVATDGALHDRLVRACRAAGSVNDVLADSLGGGVTRLIHHTGQRGAGGTISIRAGKGCRTVGGTGSIAVGNQRQGVTCVVVDGDLAGIELGVGELVDDDDVAAVQGDGLTAHGVELLAGVCTCHGVQGCTVCSQHVLGSAVGVVTEVAAVGAVLKLQGLRRVVLQGLVHAVDVAGCVLRIQVQRADAVLRNQLLQVQPDHEAAGVGINDAAELGIICPNRRGIICTVHGVGIVNVPGAVRIFDPYDVVVTELEADLGDGLVVVTACLAGRRVEPALDTDQLYGVVFDVVTHADLVPTHEIVKVEIVILSFLCILESVSGYTVAPQVDDVNINLCVTAGVLGGSEEGLLGQGSTGARDDRARAAEVNDLISGEVDVNGGVRTNVCVGGGLNDRTTILAVLHLGTVCGCGSLHGDGPVSVHVDVVCGVLVNHDVVLDGNAAGVTDDLLQTGCHTGGLLSDLLVGSGVIANEGNRLGLDDLATYLTVSDASTVLLKGGRNGGDPFLTLGVVTQSNALGRAAGGAGLGGRTGSVDPCVAGDIDHRGDLGDCTALGADQLSRAVGGAACCGDGLPGNGVARGVGHRERIGVQCRVSDGGHCLQVSLGNGDLRTVNGEHDLAAVSAGQGVQGDAVVCQQVLVALSVNVITVVLAVLLKGCHDRCVGIAHPAGVQVEYRAVGVLNVNVDLVVSVMIQNGIQNGYPDGVSARVLAASAVDAGLPGERFDLTVSVVLTAAEGGYLVSSRGPHDVSVVDLITDVGQLRGAVTAGPTVETDVGPEIARAQGQGQYACQTCSVLPMVLVAAVLLTDRVVGGADHITAGRSGILRRAALVGSQRRALTLIQVLLTVHVDEIVSLDVHVQRGGLVEDDLNGSRRGVLVIGSGGFTCLEGDRDGDGAAGVVVDLVGQGSDGAVDGLLGVRPVCRDCTVAGLLCGFHVVAADGGCTGSADGSPVRSGGGHEGQTLDISDLVADTEDSAGEICHVYGDGDGVTALCRRRSVHLQSQAVSRRYGNDDNTAEDHDQADHEGDDSFHHSGLSPFVFWGVPGKRGSL